MSLFKATLVLALLPALMTGCGPSQGPFSTDRAHNKHLVVPLPDAAGIVVRPVSGVSDAQSRALRTAMVEALSRHEIPAALTGGNRAARNIDGVATTEDAANGGRLVRIDWTLSDRNEKTQATASSTARISAAIWQDPDPKALLTLVDGAAARFTASIVEPTYGSTVPQSPVIKLHIWPITGPSDAGNELLRTAIGRALARRDFSVVGGMEQAQLILSGEVALAPPKDGKRPIEIIWAMLRPDGKELGRLNQKNTVTEDSLTSGWPGLSRAIATAAAGGVSELIRRLPAGALVETP